MTTPVYLRSLQALEMAVRKRSFTGAAHELNITSAAVGQRVKALEEYLGVDLLVRGRGGVQPTLALQSALPALHLAFETLERAVDQLEIQRWQEIHIAAPSDVAELWLAPRLSVFKANHPNIMFCVNGEGDASLRIGRVDCELSFGDNADNLESEMLFRDYVLPIASTLNVQRLAMTEPATRLEGFPLLHLDFYKNDPAGLSWSNWITANCVQRSAPDRGMRFQRVVAALDAVIADAGLTLCGLALARQRLEDGDIGLPYPQSSGRWSKHVLMARYRTESQSRPHIQLFRRWLKAQGNETIQWVKSFVSC